MKEVLVKIYMYTNRNVSLIWCSPESAKDFTKLMKNSYSI